MATMRSRRIEALLGAQVSDASYEQVAALAAGMVSEDFDLDLKSARYAPSESGRRALAGDVAAMANTSGGLIVLGMEEDKQARAMGATDMPISDDEVNRMYLTVRTGLAPMPDMNIRTVENPAKPGTGFILVSIPRSPTAPHAVKMNDGFRYPRRNGRTTTYLSENDVAQAYRERFAGLQSRLDTAVEHEKYIVDRLNTDSLTYVVVTLVPDLEGYLDIDLASADAFRKEMLDQGPMLIHAGMEWRRTSVGPGRLVADCGYSSDDSRLNRQACVLHRTGAGSFAIAVSNRARADDFTEVIDEQLVTGVLSALRFLARNARDRAAAGGSASLRATITPTQNVLPTRLVHFRHYGERQVVGEAPRAQPEAAGLADVDELAGAGPELVAATHSLVSNLMQEFGYPETPQITAQGEFRLPYWRSDVHEAVRSCAGQAGVKVIQTA